jgi:hypothetical protein
LRDETRIIRQDELHAWAGALSVPPCVAGQTNNPGHQGRRNRTGDERIQTVGYYWCVRQLGELKPRIIVSHQDVQCLLSSGRINDRQQVMSLVFNKPQLPAKTPAVLLSTDLDEPFRASRSHPSPEPDIRESS